MRVTSDPKVETVAAPQMDEPGVPPETTALHDGCYANASEKAGIGQKISPDEPEYSSTTRAERLSTYVAPLRVRFPRTARLPTRSRTKPRSIVRRCRSR